MNTPGFDVVRTDTGNAEFLVLVDLLDQELAERDGDDHAFFAQFNKLKGDDLAVVVKSSGEPVGCGALRMLEDGIFEVKRMFVKQDFRNKRLGALILGELEKRANELEASACILETGLRQPEAIRLYQREGYRQIPNYGQYAEVESSVCMKKELGNG